MPIFNAPLLEIDKKEARRYAGLRKAEFPQEIIDDACTEALILAQPKGIWNIYPYDSKLHTVMATPPFIIEGQAIAKHLNGCEKVVVLSATVGEDIEAAVTAHFNEGKYAYSTLLDAAATTAVEQIADNMEKAIANRVKREGYTMKWRFSPGYGDWPIEQQPELIRLSGANTIGVSLTDSLMLMPRKSITAIIGLYRQTSCTAEDTSQKHDCSQCSKTDCPSRREENACKI